MLANAVIMVEQPFLEIGCHPDIETPFEVLDDVDPCIVGNPERSCGAGFEPAIWHLPDYEPDLFPRES